MASRTIAAIIVGLWVLLRSVSVSAQSAPPADSSDYKLAVSHTVSQYYARAGDQATLYNGSVYPYFRFPFASGSPFFLLDTFTSGTVTYDSIRFDGVPLLYDDLREFLVTINIGYWLRLVSERVSSFEVNGSRFVRIVTDSTVRNVLKSGFYEVLYSGRNIVLKKTVKTVREDIADQTLLHSVETKIRYYLRSGGKDYYVNSLDDITDLFSDKKAELLAYRKKNKLRFKKQKQKTIVMLVSYYDQLTQGNARP